LIGDVCVLLCVLLGAMFAFGSFRCGVLVCGDVVIPAAQTVLKEMGIWQRIMERGAFRWVNKVALAGPKSDR
jgi:hypothetical protein